MPRTSQQEQALRAIRAWANDDTAKQTFVVCGAAGTGKTSLLSDLVDDLPHPIAFCAPTGRAASVMAAKGCVDAVTCHRLVYRPVEEVDAHGNRRLTFVLNACGPAAGAKLIVVDEASMIGPELTRALRSFGKKVLAIGDPGQLPPPDGDAPFMRGRPDVLLTEVHRQAADSPIIALATKVRAGKRLKPGRYGDSEIVGPSGLDAARILGADQVLVGTNTLRARLIRRLRQIRGAPEGIPIAGDRLVCLRNNAKRGFFNGGTWTVDDVLAPRPDGAYRLVVRPDADSGLRPDLTRRIAVQPEFFRGAEATLSPFELSGSDHFSFADALSVHKAQGSQWPDVALFDETHRFPAIGTRLLYTALTRAAERVTVVMQPVC